MLASREIKSLRKLLMRHPYGTILFINLHYVRLPDGWRFGPNGLHEIWWTYVRDRVKVVRRG